MTLEPRFRSYLRMLAVTALCALALFQVAGHIFGHSQHSGDDLASGAAGICLVLFTLMIRRGTAPSPADSRPRPGPRQRPVMTRFLVALALDGRARGSPAQLQRFLH